MPRGGPGALPLVVSKDAGVELLAEARAKLIELGRVADEGGNLCRVEAYDGMGVLVKKGAANIAMDAGADAYTVVNLKKTALRPTLLAGSAECDEMQMRQYVQAGVKAIDEMVAIGKMPTKRDDDY